MKESLEIKDPQDPEILRAIQLGFELKSQYEEHSLLVEPRYSHEESFNSVLKKLGGTGLYPVYRKTQDGYSLKIVDKKGKRKEIRPLFHVVLIIATIFTVMMAGYIWWAAGDIKNSLYFTISLMAILGGHELGHALIARRNSVDATLPFFLPVPPFFAFGTLGAVIFMNSPIPDRKSLFDIGIAGPLTGFILSFPVLIIGISLSSYVPFDPVQEGGSILLGTPILFNILSSYILGAPGDGFILQAHPIAIAGWAGLFVTALNLIPMGQLDGGHIIRSLFPKGSKKVYVWVYRILFLTGAVGLLAHAWGFPGLANITWPGWLFWALLVYFMTRLEHPGPLNDVVSLDRRRKAESIIVLITFLISFTPVPIMSV